MQISTNSAILSATAPPAVESTDTPKPTKTHTPKPPPTNTPEPTATNTLKPTATPIPEKHPIVFSSTRGGPNSFDLYLIDPESLEITPLNTGFDFAILSRISPDDNTIAFTVRNPWAIYTINTDGTNLTQLTDFSSANPDW